MVRHLSVVGLLSLVTAMVAPASAQDEDPGAGAPAAAETEASGPELQLEGLDVEALTGEVPPGPTSQAADADPFGQRVDKSATLAERAAGIVDRTTLGGYGQHELIAGESEATRFRNHRYVIFVYSQISERISTATEIEFEFAGSPLKKDGILGAGEVLLEFSVVDFEVAPWLLLRAGVILVPVGSFNIRHDAPTRDLVDRPIAYTTVVPTTWFESGAGLHGAIAMGETQRLSYELYAVNGLDARIFDGFGLRAARGSHFEDNNSDKAITGRLAWSPDLGLEVGLSGYSGEYDLRDNRVQMLNLDLLWRRGPLEVLGEMVYVWIDPGFVEGFPEGSAANTRDAVPGGMSGFYGQVNYHFQVPWLWAHLPEDLRDSTLTAVLRYEGKDTNRDYDSAVGDQRRLTVGLNYRPIEAFVWKLDLQWNSKGRDGRRDAPELWQPGFWHNRDGQWQPDRFVSSVAYLF